MKINITKPTVCGGKVHHLKRNEKSGAFEPKKGVECDKTDAALLMKMGKAEPADDAAKALLAKLDKSGNTDALIEGK